jgi:hypothetical protein
MTRAMDATPSLGMPGAIAERMWLIRAFQPTAARA